MERILHIIAQYPGKTGSGVFLQSLVREASKKGHIQCVVSAVSDKLEKVKFEGNMIEFYPVKFNTEKMCFDIVGMSDVMPYSSTKYSELSDEMFNIWKEEFLYTIEKAIKEFNPSIIISHHLWILTGLVTKMKGNAKMIVPSQGTELRQMRLSPKYKNLVIDGCRKVDVVCALNSFQKKEIERIYNIDSSKIKIMGVGYNSDIFYPDINEKKLRRVVFVGKLCESKGVKSLISAFKKIVDNDIELIIIGSGVEEDSIKLSAKEDRRIKFLGILSQEELSDVLRKSELFILPSFYEGLPLVIMEALACNVKVIVSDIEGIKSWVGEKINNSNAITYIKLPRLNIDVPYKEDIPNFEDSIVKGIIKNIDKKVDFASIEEEIKKRSWNSYFDNLSKEFI